MSDVDGSTNGDRPPADLVQLERLVGRALDELRERTSASDGDVGVTLVELLAWASDLLSCYAEQVADEAHLSSARRRLSVLVDGLPWRQVQDLGRSGADDQHVVVRPGEDGTSVIEFGDGAHGSRPPSDATIEARFRTPGQSASVRVEPGRVIIGPARVAEATGWWGVYQGLVVDRADPLTRSRLRVRLPALGDDVAMWAAACLPAGARGELPEVGDQVWVAFEGGDPSFPVWLGVGVRD